MTRRIKRTPDFELSLQLKRDDFIRPPRDAQRNWLLNGAVGELTENLASLDRLAARFVPGTDQLETRDRSQSALRDEEIMEEWQVPLMRAMAQVVTASRGDILEVGFGRGVSSSFIQQFGAASHTIIECNASICARFERWRAEQPGKDISIVQGLWQDVLPQLGQFDGVFFHTYPLNETEFIEHIAGSTTFAEHFFEHAAAHLVEGGIFTYLSNEIDSLGRGHQRALLRHFRSLEIQVVDGLELPQQVRDAWWADSMVVVKAVK